MKKQNEEWTIIGRFLREYAYFTKAERRGIMVLLMMTMMVWTVPTILPYLLPKQQEKIAGYTQMADEYFSASPTDGNSLQRSAPTTFSRDISSKKNPTRPEKYTRQKKPVAAFSFDPNTLPKDSLLLLGIPEKVVNILDNYRQKGGKFFKKEDLMKVYGFRQADFERLSPFIHLENENRKNQYKYSTKKYDYPVILDINAAAEEDWKRLKGIGPYYSRKIVAYRDHLGGFSSINQVAEVFGFPDSVFQKIKDHLKLEQPVFRKIRLDTTDLQNLENHPYISRRQAKGLAAFINNHGPIKDPKILRETGLFSEEDVNRLVPYLQ